MEAKRKPGLLRLSLTNMFLYAADMGCAIGGFVLGFGLDVKNWWAVIGFMIVARWVFFVTRCCWEIAEKKRAKATGAPQP